MVVVANFCSSQTFYPNLPICLHGYIRHIRDILQLWEYRGQKGAQGTQGTPGKQGKQGVQGTQGGTGLTLYSEELWKGAEKSPQIS